MKCTLFLLALVIVFVLSGCNFSLAADVTPPPGYQPPPEVQATGPAPGGQVFPVVPPDPAQGAAIFAEKCAPCHGESGLGDGPQAASLPNPVPALGSPEVSRGARPSDWFTIVSQGNLERFMPPFRSLSDHERWDVVAYALTLSGSPDNLASGTQLFQQNCASCHGAGGRGDGPQASGMAVKDLTDQELMSGKSANDFFQAISQGVGDQMPAFSDKLSETERWALADYLRSLTFTSGAVAAVTPEPGQPTAIKPTGEVASTPSISETQTLGSVTGFVMNASGGPAPPGAEINLHAFDQMQIVYTDTTTLEDDGSYSFVNQDMPPGRAFLTTVDYGGVVYGSDIAVAEAGKTSLELPLRIYDSTTDPASLSVDRLHYFLEFVDAKTLRVLELYIISNPGNKTVVAAKEGDPVLSFQLPEGATNLQFEDNTSTDRYITIPGGFGDNVPVRPGSGNYQVMYSYELPYNRKLDLSRPMAMPVQAVVILVPEESIKIKGEGIQDAGTRDIQGIQYQMYNGQALQAGNNLQFTVTGKPAGGSSALTSGSSTNMLIGAGILGVVLVAAGVWIYLRNRPEPEDDQEDEMPLVDAAPESADSIMDAILALDDLYQDGKLPEDAYRQRREELKRRLEGVVGKA